MEEFVNNIILIIFNIGLLLMGLVLIWCVFTPYTYGLYKMLSNAEIYTHKKSIKITFRKFKKKYKEIKWDDYCKEQYIINDKDVVCRWYIRIDNTIYLLNYYNYCRYAIWLNKECKKHLSKGDLVCK